MGIGAVLFAAVLADDGYAWWPGIPAGIAAAWLAGTAARDVLARAGGRLDDEARSHLPVYAEGVALALARCRCWRRRSAWSRSASSPGC